MGNCQTVDAAALVIQHPNGQTERKYWTVPASEVMKLNPGHYVSLIIPLPEASDEEKTTEKTVKFTRVKLLRPSDTLVLGRAYRLVTSQEVMKVLRAKKSAKTKKNQVESSEKLEMDPDKQSSNSEAGGGQSELEKTSQVLCSERTMLCTFNPSDRASNVLDIISATNDREPFIAEMRSELLNARYDGLEAMRHERHRQRTGSTNSAAARARSWRPSLNSISESGS